MKKVVEKVAGEKIGVQKTEPEWLNYIRKYEFKINLKASCLGFNSQGENCSHWDDVEFFKFN